MNKIKSLFCNHIFSFNKNEFIGSCDKCGKVVKLNEDLEIDEDEE